MKDTADTGHLVSFNRDSSNVGAKFFGGYRLNPYLGLEAAYSHFGKEKYSYTDTGLTGAGELKAEAFSLAATGRLPINDVFAATGKSVSHASIATTTRAGLTRVPGQRQRQPELDGADARPGRGVYTNKSLSIRAEYEATARRRSSIRATSVPPRSRRAAVGRRRLPLLKGGGPTPRAPEKARGRQLAVPAPRLSCYVIDRHAGAVERCGAGAASPAAGENSWQPIEDRSAPTWRRFGKAARGLSRILLLPVLRTSHVLRAAWLLRRRGLGVRRGADPLRRQQSPSRPWHREWLLWLLLAVALLLRLGRA